MKARLAVILFFAAFASSLHAEIIELVIPVVVRAPSSGGTAWRTDLVVTNGMPIDTRLNIAYYSGGVKREEVRTLGPYASLTVADVVGHFGQETGSGILRIESNIGFVSARARIYRIGLAKGDVGQIIPAQIRQDLMKDSLIAGVSSGDGTSVNVGIANPNDIPTDAYLTVFDKNGEPHYFLTEVVAANSFLQLNNLLRGLPADGDYSIRIATRDQATYAYASIVHGSEDADFVPAEQLVPNP